MTTVGAGIVLLLVAAAPARGGTGEVFAIKGRVVDSQARPVAGAEVAVFEKLADYPGAPPYVRTLAPTVRSDPDGRFRFNVQAESQYFTFVVARKDGLAMAWDRLNVNSNRRYDIRCYLVMEEPVAITGQLLDPQDRPVVGAQMRVVPKNSYLRRLRQKPICGPEAWLTVTTDEQGNFALGSLPADASADFWVQLPGRDVVYEYTPHWLNAVGYEAGTEDLTLALPPGTTIRGRVVDNGRQRPVEGVRLILKPRDMRDCRYRYSPYPVASGADGSFIVAGVPPGRHVLAMITRPEAGCEWIGRSVPIELDGSEKARDVTFVVEKGTPLDVSARHFRTRRPLGSVAVDVLNAEYQGFDGDTGFHRTVRTSADGTARIYVPTGACRVFAWGDDARGSREGVAVTVTGGKPAQLGIGLLPRGRLAGTVVDESGRPAPGAVVPIIPFGHTVFADSRGRFEAKPDFQYPTKMVGARDVGRNLAGVAKVGRSARSLRVALKPAVSVTGRITDANENGVPAARVRLSFHADNASSIFDEVLADGEGRYRIDAVVPQRDGFHYRLEVSAAGYGPVEHRRVSIRGEPGDTVELPDVELMAANASLTGRVIDQQGRPVSGAPVFVGGTMQFDQPDKTVSTDAQGRFAVSRICPGPLKLQANFPSSPGGKGETYAYGGNRDVKVVLGKDLTHVGDASLVGKKLPDLTRFEAEGLAKPVSGRRTLICFFALSPPPAQECLKRLEAMAPDLHRDGVDLMCVEATARKAEALANWRRKQRISLPMATTEPEPVKVRQQWAVRSVPWLILTDSDGIVTAEGFDLDRLSARLREGR
jgi:protocatechuate 3,4-dioxygenase beta subunit